MCHQCKQKAAKYICIDCNEIYLCSDCIWDHDQHSTVEIEKALQWEHW